MNDNHIEDQKLLELARAVVQQEAHALTTLAAGLGDSFGRAVRLIHRCRGRVIVTGMGKSALIGQKIAATFNSMGTPALFMHAADAVHGDLGMLQQEDVVLCLSKSGETAEVKTLVPFIRSRQLPVIGIVGHESSYLAQQADLVIITPIHREADLHDLAPTASTMAQMAVGDALAVAVASCKNFQPEDFALLHPGGTLGKRLHLRVRDLCARHEAPGVDLHASIHAVIMEISSKRLGATAVLDTQGQLSGIITDGDLRRMLEKTMQWQSLRASDIMSRQPRVVDIDALAWDALLTMRNHNITQLLVVEQEVYRGVVHIHDLLQEGLN